MRFNHFLGSRSDRVVCAFDGARADAQERVEAGVFLTLWRAGVERFDELRGIDWDWGALDGAMTKAPLGGGKKPGLIPRIVARAASNTACCAARHGVPIGTVIEGAQRHDMKLVRATIQSIIVERPKPPEEQPQGMCLDKGYDSDEVYAIVQEFGHNPPMCAHAPKRPGLSNGKLVSKRADG